jgi:hypothetical protein
MRARSVSFTVADLHVGALLYRVTNDRTFVDWLHEGRRDRTELLPTHALVPMIEELRAELENANSLAQNRTPKLDGFAADWGARLLPAGLTPEALDILVVVPHSLFHDLPLHLVTPAGWSRSLGESVGVSFVSSMSLFERCALRNSARKREPSTWRPKQPQALGSGEHQTTTQEPIKVLTAGFDALTQEVDRFSLLADHLFDHLATPVEKIPLGIEPGPIPRWRIKDILSRESGVDVICLAAHGFIDPEFHGFSGLAVGTSLTVLSKSFRILEREVLYQDMPLRDIPFGWATQRPSEALTVAELEVDAGTTAGLVALLACSAGASDRRQGDAPTSVAEAFLRAGAATVLSSPWPADAEVTEAWMQTFLTAWLDDDYPKALAARRAYEVARESYPFPAKWGALALKGDWV